MERLLKFGQLTAAEREEYRRFCRTHWREARWHVESDRANLHHFSFFHAFRSIIFGAKDLFYNDPRFEAFQKELLSKYKCDDIDSESFPDYNHW